MVRSSGRCELQTGSWNGRGCSLIKDSQGFLSTSRAAWFGSRADYSYKAAGAVRQTDMQVRLRCWPGNVSSVHAKKLLCSTRPPDTHTHTQTHIYTPQLIGVASLAWAAAPPISSNYRKKSGCLLPVQTQPVLVKCDRHGADLLALAACHPSTRSNLQWRYGSVLSVPSYPPKKISRRTRLSLRAHAGPALSWRQQRKMFNEDTDENLWGRGDVHLQGDDP